MVVAQNEIIIGLLESIDAKLSILNDDDTETSLTELINSNSSVVISEPVLDIDGMFVEYVESTIPLSEVLYEGLYRTQTINEYDENNEITGSYTLDIPVVSDTYQFYDSYSTIALPILIVLMMFVSIKFIWGADA